jgi:hypothetical protein
VGATFFWWDVLLDVVGEDELADLVVVARGDECEDCGEFGRDLSLELLARTECLGGGAIDGDDDGELSFFLVSLDEGLAGARGDIPVDGADVVARLVLADLGELDALSLEGGVVLAAEQIVDATARADLRRRTSFMSSSVSMTEGLH